MVQTVQPYKRITAEDFLGSNLEISSELSQRAYLNVLEDMQEEKKAMEEQRAATFNILEDISEAQEELKKRYIELDTLKDLIKDLGSSLKTGIVLRTLIKALEKILPEPVSFAYAIPSPDPGKPSNLIYAHSRAALGKKYLDSVKNNIASSFDSLPAEVKRKKELVKWIRGEFIFEFVRGTRDDKDIKQPLSLFNAPFVVRDEVLGAINISSPRPNLFTEKDINLVHTMVGATASTISRLRQLLQSEQSRIASLVESLSNGVIMFDLDQRVTMSNPAAQKMTGLPAQGFYLSEFTKLFRNGFDKKIEQALQSGQSFEMENVTLSRFTYEGFVTAVRDYEKKIIGGAIILHDITHLKEIDKMKTEFVSVASHQLRTPLTAIKLFVEMLANEEVGGLNSTQKDYMDNVQKSTKRMIALVNDLLNVSRIETGRLKIEPKMTQLEDFIQSIINESILVLEVHNCKVAFRKPAKKLPEIPIDQTLVQQVIHNLIANAIRYSSLDRCGIMVKLEYGNNKTIKQPSNKAIKQESNKSEIENLKSEILISVQDSGIGIPKEVQPRIFQKFFRADNAQRKETEGSGLGLYVAKMIVEASGGKIWFESEENKGTTFYVSLPAKGMKAKEGETGLVE